MPWGNNEDWMDQETVDQIKKHERPVPHMYLDTKGNATVGIGKIIPDVNTAKSLQFRVDDQINGRYATSSEVERAYNKVKSSLFGKSMGSQIFTPDGIKYDKLYMDDNTQDSLFRTDLDRSKQELEKKFTGFDAFPKPAKAALLDMQFNMGDTKFQTETYDPEKKTFKPAWPKLFDAVNRQDWKAAGDESHRKDVGDERNRAVKDLFDQAGGDGFNE
jgi:GH24 family phage-related lysozyme (muramidase)